MPTMKMEKKDLISHITFQNINKIIATILTIITTTAFFNGDFKLMLILFTFSLVFIFTLSTIDYSIRTKKNSNEISSPFADVLNKNKQVVHEEKSRTEVQGAAKPKSFVPKTDNEIVDELKGGLNKNNNQNSSTSNPSKNRRPKSNDELFENKNKPTYPMSSSNSSINDMSDLFLKDEGKDEDRLI